MSEMQENGIQRAMRVTEELQAQLAAATKRAEEAEATANLYQVELRLAGEEQLRRNEEHAREVAGCRDLIAKQRTRIAWLESISEPDDFRDHVAISAMQSLILKVPLHDRKGEYGIHSPEIADIHQVRLDIAGSAYDYADAMRTARCEQRVADEPTPPVEFTVNADGPLDDEALRCAGEVARQVVYGKRRKG